MKWERFENDSSFLVLGEERRSYCASTVEYKKSDNEEAREKFAGIIEKGKLFQKYKPGLMGNMAYATWVQTWAFAFQKSGLFGEQSQTHNPCMSWVI